MKELITYCGFNVVLEDNDKVVASLLTCYTVDGNPVYKEVVISKDLTTKNPVLLKIYGKTITLDKIDSNVKISNYYELHGVLLYIKKLGLCAGFEVEDNHDFKWNRVEDTAEQHSLRKRSGGCQLYLSAHSKKLYCDSCIRAKYDYYRRIIENTEHIEGNNSKRTEQRKKENNSNKSKRKSNKMKEKKQNRQIIIRLQRLNENSENPKEECMGTNKCTEPVQEENSPSSPKQGNSKSEPFQENKTELHQENTIQIRLERPNSHLEIFKEECMETNICTEPAEEENSLTSPIKDDTKSEFSQKNMTELHQENSGKLST